MNIKNKKLPRIEKLKVIERDGLKCYECKKILSIVFKDRKFKVLDGHFHHIIPQVYGGRNESQNACLLCKKCHIKIHSGNEEEEKYFIHLKNFYQNKKMLYGTT